MRYKLQNVFLGKQTKKFWYKAAINLWFEKANGPLNLCWLGTWVFFLLQPAPDSYT